MFSILLVQGLAFFMIKYLPLTEVTIFLSMGPILTVFVSSCFLADAALKTKTIETLKLIVGCIGVIMIVIGKKVYMDEHGSVDLWPTKLWHYGVIALAPIAIVIINLSLSTMRNLHYIVTPFYISVLTVTICGVIGLFNMESFLPQKQEFQSSGVWLFWVLVVVVNGSCNVFAFLFKVLAYRHDRVQRLAPIFYVETVIQMVCDVYVFKVRYNWIQLTGLVLVLVMFGVILITAYVVRPKEEFKYTQVLKR